MHQPLTRQELRAAYDCAVKYPRVPNAEAWFSRRVSNAEEVREYG